MDILDLVHDDICGPITLMTPSDSRYFLLLVDDKSRYMCQWQWEETWQG